VVNKRDQQFFDGFMLIVGIFVGIVAGIILLGDLIGEGMHAEEGAAHSAVIERIRPVGEVALIGDSAIAAASAGGAVAPPAAAAAAPLSGGELYDQICALCHAAGIAGAPMITDLANWAPRIEQGTDVLRDHVLNGFQGSAGVMPAKGGRADLSDDEVLAAMQYMLDRVAQ
jgi:cytochrome c5